MTELAAPTRAMWRAIRDAGDEGLASSLVYSMRGTRTRNTFGTCLQWLKSKGHLRCSGSRRGCRWHVGQRPIKGESLVRYAPTVDKTAAAVHVMVRRFDDSEREAPLYASVQGVPRGVPCSVWHLATLIQQGLPCA